MDAKEFKSFYKTVGGNEGGKCHYPTRLDTYGCGCSHDCQYCVDGNTNVLMYDGSTRKIKDINIGDEIYGVVFDGKYYRFTKSIVENKWSVRKPSYKIILANGTELICSGDHRWLTNRGWKYTTGAMAGPNRRPYITTKNSLKGLSTLTFGDYTETEEYMKGYLSGVIREDGNLTEHHYENREYRTKDDQYHFRLAMKEVQPIERTKMYLDYFGIDTNWFKFPILQRQTKEARLTDSIRTNKKANYDHIKDLIKYVDSDEYLRGFLAGIYDAEGTSNIFVKRIFNTNDEIIKYVENGLTRFGFRYTFDNEKQSPNGILKTVRILGGVSEFVRFFMVTNPAIKRYGCLENVVLKNERYGDLKIMSIEPYENDQELWDITTSTENFIANGVVSHNCYAKSLLDFRKMWDPEHPAVADIEKIRRKVAKIPEGTPAIRLGGMTDCFQPIEKIYGVTYETIKALNEKKQPYLIVTKSALVADDKYIEILDKELAHIQITITTTDDDFSLTYEKASVPSERIKAIEKLQANGFDVSVRLSPYIKEFVDLDIINSIKCDKILVEFLRVNSWIEKWFGELADLSNHTVKHGGYKHLPLEKKKELISKITGFKEITVCEDETEAYEYWKNNFNPNPDDCCNLRKAK